MVSYLKSERVMLRNHPEFSEKWVQAQIVADPSILGLGELVVREQERIQPRAGRLDMLLQHVETKRRFEAELQLGATDEAHIIRTIEYWDIERRRYPQYDHAAVIIAEDITSRFLNVIGLFNGAIPLIAIQMQALMVGDNLTLSFVTVVSELSRGLVDEDEDAEAAPADRAYWERKATPETVRLADRLLLLAQRAEPVLELKYNKFYIGLSRNDQPFNIAIFRPRKNHLLLELRLPETAEVTEQIEASGIELQDYDSKFSAYRLRILEGDVQAHEEMLVNLMQLAHDHRSS